MHLLIKNIVRWRDERYQIIFAEHEIERLEAEFKPKIEAVRKPPWNDYQSLVSEYLFERNLQQAIIDDIETKRLIRAARRHGIPIPKRPMELEDNEFWEHSQVGHILTLEGRRRLRHEVALEREMLRKPLVAWAAILISLVSLALSGFSFFLN